MAGRVGRGCAPKEAGDLLKIADGGVASHIVFLLDVFKFRRVDVHPGQHLERETGPPLHPHLVHAQPGQVSHQKCTRGTKTLRLMCNQGGSAGGNKDKSAPKGQASGPVCGGPNSPRLRTYQVQEGPEWGHGHLCTQCSSLPTSVMKINSVRMLLSLCTDAQAYRQSVHESFTFVSWTSQLRCGQRDCVVVKAAQEKWHVEAACLPLLLADLAKPPPVPSSYL